MGEGRVREFFISGDKLNAEKALQAGLVNQVVDDDQLDIAVNKLLQSVLSSGPKAVAMAKKLLSDVPQMTPAEFIPHTAELIAKLRVSDEGQEGMDSFLNKRKPKWAK